MPNHHEKSPDDSPENKPTSIFDQIELDIGAEHDTLAHDIALSSFQNAFQKEYKIDQLLRENDGITYFHNYYDDAEYKIAITNRNNVAKGNDTAIIINKLRSANPGEPNFPDGRVLEGLDFVFSRDFTKVNHTRQTLYNDHHTNKWSTTEAVSIVDVRDDKNESTLEHRRKLYLFGPIRHPRAIKSRKAKTRQNKVDDVAALMDVVQALHLCNNVGFCPEVQEFYWAKKSS